MVIWLLFHVAPIQPIQIVSNVRDLVLLLKTGLSADDNVARSTKKSRGMFFTTLQWLRPLSLASRRIRGDLTCMYKIMHDLLDFPGDTVFSDSTHMGLRGHAFTNSGVKSIAANLRSTFE